MSKIICNSIKVWKKSSVVSTTENSIEIKPGEEPVKIQLLRNTEFEIAGSDSENGFLSEFSMTALMDNTDANQFKNYRRSLILELRTNENTTVIAGTIEFPIKAVISKNVNFSTVLFTCSSPDN